MMPWTVIHQEWCGNKDLKICECLKDCFDRMSIEMESLRERLEARTSELSELKRKIALKKNVP